MADEPTELTPEKKAGFIERTLDGFGRPLAPLLPWIFLALRRAPIVTLVSVIVAMLFFVVPQSREVLHGLGEAPAGFANVWGYVFYVCTAVGLGLATWYSARLLCTVDAALATPNALESPERFTGLERAITWLPRCMGVFVLGAAMGALLFASYTPTLTRVQALALIAVAIGGPLVVTVASLIAARFERWRFAGRPAKWLGIVLTLAADAALIYLADGRWLLGVASAIVSTFPAVLLWFLEKRRSMLGDNSQRAHEQRTFQEAIVALFAIVLTSTAFLMLLAFLPPRPVRVFGSAAAVLLFLGAACLLLSGAHIMVRRIGRNVSGLTAFALIVLAVLVAKFGKESLGYEQLAPAGAVAPTAARPVDAPAPNRPLYVNAHGGGLRAAAFTAQVLASADDASCGQFGEQVAAFSGVSGGSLGIATYLVARQAFVEHHRGWPKSCTPGVSGSPMPLTEIVTAALLQDHLSPAVARMLSVDAPHLPWSPARGQALLDSWHGALAASLSKNLDGKEPAALALRLGSLTGGLAEPPLVFFNATDADTGHIVAFKNLGGGEVMHFGLATRAVPDITVGQAVLHSARFPIVSPAGGIELWEDATNENAKGKVKLHRLVDGGYADNSGTKTLLLALVPTAETRLVNIDGNPPEGDCKALTARAGEADDKPPMITAVGALLHARIAHAKRAVEEFKSAVSWRAVDVVLDLEKTISGNDPKERCEKLGRLHPPPLGWYMSASAARDMGKSVAVGKEMLCEALGAACIPRGDAQN
jgi:hypothetical protein